ncbi:MAG: caspase family protein [Saprospiraceae bacterium]
MKHLLFYTLLLALALSAREAPARKIALLVGIGEYQQAPFSNQSLQAEKAIKLMQLTLMKQGFAEANILVLSNAGATSHGIQQALQEHLFRAEDGDVVVFYYYGHGVQIADDNDDEADKLDEAIVPFNGYKANNKEHRNLIRDDQLGVWIQHIRKKCGPQGQVLVLIDACHSGGGVRGGRTKTKSDRYKLSNTTTASDDLAPFIAFYSSMPHQASLEMQVEENTKLSLLTWAFCKAMHQLVKGSTYRGVFEKTAQYMATKPLKQTPQLEGMQDMLVFGGLVSTPPPYFKPLLMLDDREMMVTGGRMHGLQAGTRMAVYPPETRDTSLKAPLAMGTVQEIGLGLLECTVILDKPIAEADGAAAWLFVKERSFAGYNLELCLQIDDSDLKKQLTNRLASLASVQLTDSPEANLILKEDRKNLLLQSMDGFKLWEEVLTNHRVDNILQSLQFALGNYLQAQFLKGLEFEGSPYRADFTVQVGKENATGVGRLRMNKDTATLRVVNQGTSPIYYTIIDIDARNIVSILLPRQMDLPADYRLEPGEESPPHKVRFNSEGREVLKLVITDRPINLYPVVASRGRADAGSGFFENLFASSYWNGEKSRGPSGHYIGNEAGVETIVLEVVK